MLKRQAWLDDMLDAIDTLLLGKLSDDVQHYKIEGRELTKLSLPELNDLRIQLYREATMIENALTYPLYQNRVVYTEL